jgi:glutathione S-transferase
MICEYGDLKYEAKCYEIHKQADGSWDKTEWFGTKPDLKAKNAFMNLPYVTDGDVVISQTIACLQYLGKKANLYGATPEDARKVDQVLCEAQDLRNGGVGLFYSKGGDQEARVAKLEDLKGNYEKFETWLTQQGTLYTAGATPTAGDFHLWEMLDQFELMAEDSKVPGPLAGFPNLKKLHETLRADPKLAKYFASDLYKLPPNNKFAGWGGGEPADWAKLRGY